MKELFQFQWREVDWLVFLKVSLGLVIMLVLTETTGESWLATALAAMFAWLANTPGALRNRVAGMMVFAAVAVLITLLTGLIGLNIPANVLAIAVIGFACTVAMAWGIRAFMVGFAIICWAIYQPFLVAATSVANCILAVVVGTGVVILLNVLGERLFQSREPALDVEGRDEETPAVDWSFVLAYALTIAAVLALTTWLGWETLETDPTLVAGGAFFVIGPDARKTWAAGIGRALGLLLGVAIGLGLAMWLGPGPVLWTLMILAAGLSFGTFAVHPGAWMFFFMLFAAMGWPELDPEVFEKTLNERFAGELAGIAIAMAALTFLQFWQNRSAAGDQK